MSLHQIIYTSCKRGINGVNDGQQVFSYDIGFTNYNSDEIKALFGYQLPSLAPGVIMTEELALTMPKSYVYRKLDDGRCALALNTYLGRDYMGSSGRFGNHLSHVVVFDESDIQNYPCEFYQGPLLRSSMTYEEVNNPEKPDYLPTPILEKGYKVDVDSVIEFLGIGNRLEIYKNMLCAMLAFSSQRKRVVICDDEQNIIMWIGALEYALPIRNVLEINFSTYDFNPSLSTSQICGVLSEGTRFNSDSVNHHFVFDIKKDIIPNFDKDPDFFDFIDTAMSLSYESLQDFHNFLSSGYHYYSADEEIYDAYRLYSMLSDEVISNSKEILDSALNFARKYANDGQESRIINSILRQSQWLLNCEYNSFVTVLEYLSEYYSKLDFDSQSQIRNTVVNRILFEFVSDSVEEKAFSSFYSSIEIISKKCGFNVPSELMKRENQKTLFAVMNTDISEWKLAFVIHIVSEFAKSNKQNNHPLSINSSLGQIYYGIIRAVYSRNERKGIFAIIRIVDEFSNDSVQLLNTVLDLEELLENFRNGNLATEKMWNFFYKTVLGKYREKLESYYKALASCKKYENIFMLYSLAINNAVSLEDAARVFDVHFNRFAQYDRFYFSNYSVDVLSLYYDSINHYSSDEAASKRYRLFNLITSQQIDVPFFFDLSEKLTSKLTLEKPKFEDEQLIKSAVKYITQYKKQAVTGKTALLIVGLALESVQNNKPHFEDRLKYIHSILKTKKAELNKYSIEDINNYFEWILPVIFNICDEKSELEDVYSVFSMSESVNTLFFAQLTKLYVKEYKNDKNCENICYYLGFIFAHINENGYKEVGKILCKLGKPKLAELDIEINNVYKSDKYIIKVWNEVKTVAESTNPVLNNLTSIFKKKNK